MNCPQCSNELPDSAISCPRCGASIQPVAFSYLPTGTPAWPTNVPPASSYTPVPSFVPVQQNMFVVASEKAKPRRSTGSILLIIALFILTPIVGGGLTLGYLALNGQFSTNTTTTRITTLPTVGITPTSTTQGDQLPTPTSYQTLNSTELGITTKYPSDWTKQGPQTLSDGSLDLAVSPSSSLKLGIVMDFERLSATSTANAKSATDINQENFTSFRNTSGFYNVQTTTSSLKQMGGVSWNEQDGSFTNSNADVFHLISIAVQHNKIYYLVTIFSPEAYYNEALQKYFQPMFDSFQFLS